MNTAGLRRFATPAAGPDAAAVPPPGERCEMCRVALGDRHGHVVALERRSLLCACRACWLLFTRDGAAGGRFRSVPDRWLHDPALRLTGAEWDELAIPVTTAFFFTNSDLGRVVACYPSPAGATESLLDLAAWERLAAGHPLLAAPAPDVEAVYVTHTGAGPEAFLVPIDACYALVGEIRLHWRGIDGGGEVRRVLAGFVDEARSRSRVWGSDRWT
jgi:hypothetical protein